MWIVPRFLISWRRDIRPHVILKSDLIEQLLRFCEGDGTVLARPVLLHFFLPGSNFFSRRGCSFLATSPVVFFIHVDVLLVSPIGLLFRILLALCLVLMLVRYGSCEA